MIRIAASIFFLSFSLIIQAESVRLTTTDWPPYVSKKLKGTGYVYALVTTAFKQAGYDPIVEFLPWAEALNLEEHENDAYFPGYSSEETDTIICSNPLSTSPIGLYKHKNTIIHYTLKDPRKHQTQAFYNLQQYKFGVVKKMRNTNAFDNANFLTKVSVASDLANLQQLKNRDVDLIISDIFVTEYYKDQFRPKFNDIEFLAPSLETRNLRVCFSKNAPNYKAKLDAFNKAFAEMTRNQQTDAIIAEYSY